MKVLLVHNFYLQPGGEDQVFADEIEALEAHGHQVIPLKFHNEQIQGMSRLTIAGKTIWNKTSYNLIRETCRRERPDIIHFQNTFPLVSPAAYHAARAEGVPVVQELQNFRLLCPSAVFYRQGRVCEDCLGKFIPWPGVLHACYRGSRATTAATAAMLTFHRFIGTYKRTVDAYLVVTEFGKRKFIEGGLPPEKIFVKPNWVDPDPGPGPGDGGYAAFVGRLAPEKGIDTLIRAWTLLGNLIPLKIVGDGPLAETVRAAAEKNPGIEWVGRVPTSQVLEIVGRAKLLAFPSEWYEGFPKTIVESLARGTPVVASRLGAMAEVIEHGKTGLHFEPGNAADLATQVRQLISDPPLLAEMRNHARQRFLSDYTRDHGYDRLLSIYQTVIERCKTPARPAEVPSLH